jgi:nicotinamidase-related amidase
MEPYVSEESISKKTEVWLETIAPFNTHKMKICCDRSALLVIDMQEYFLDPHSPTYTCGGQAILAKLRQLISAFRETRRPIIYTKHVHHPDNLDSGIMGWWWKGMCIEGSPESEIHHSISPRSDEKIICKHRYSAFYNTDLEIILRCLKIEDLVISGIMTNMCCESKARDAYYRDYRIFFPADGTGSINEEMHVASLLNIAFGFAFVTTVGKIVEEFENCEDASIKIQT